METILTQENIHAVHVFKLPLCLFVILLFLSVKNKTTAIPIRISKTITVISEPTIAGKLSLGMLFFL